MNWLWSFLSAEKRRNLLPDALLKFSFLLLFNHFTIQQIHTHTLTNDSKHVSGQFFLSVLPPKLFEHQQIAIIDGVKVLWCASERRWQKKKNNDETEWFSTLNAFYEIVGANPMKPKIYDAIYAIIHTFQVERRKKANRA